MTQVTTDRDREILGRTEEPEKYTGYALHDPLNQWIGRVERVFVSAFGEPQYIRVGFRGPLLKRHHLLLPVERVAVSTEHMTMILQ